MLYSEWLDQDLVGRIQIKSHPIIFSLASLVLEGTLANCSVFNIPSIKLRPDKYNKIFKNRYKLMLFIRLDPHPLSNKVVT